MHVEFRAEESASISVIMHIKLVVLTEIWPNTEGLQSHLGSQNWFPAVLHIVVDLIRGISCRLIVCFLWWARDLKFETERMWWLTGIVSFNSKFELKILLSFSYQSHSSNSIVRIRHWNCISPHSPSGAHYFLGGGLLPYFFLIFWLDYISLYHYPCISSLVYNVCLL